MTPVTVNGRIISDSAIAAEMQHHPADTPEAARDAATRALALKALMLEEAARLGISPEPETDEDGRVETEEEALVRTLIEKAVPVPPVDPVEVRAYYEANPELFRSEALFEVSHILFAAAPSDEAARASARAEAAAVIQKLDREPATFAQIARDRSGCPSGASGGNLGQLTLDDIVPEIASFIAAMDQPGLCPVPVPSRFGLHVLRLDRRIDGRELPYDYVAAEIAERLVEAAWRRAAARWLGELAARAKVEGVELKDHPDLD